MSGLRNHGQTVGNPLEAVLPFGQVVRRTAGRLDPRDSADLTQDVWVAALIYPPRSDANLAAWLSRLTRSAAARRQRARQLRRDAEALWIENGARMASQARSLIPDLEEQEHTHARLGAVLRLLSPTMREVIRLRYLEERGVSEVARTLGIPIGTVRTRLRRALAKMRMLLNRTE
jgi:RNA polymerase sigma-70 factor, ECF subfamily